jgi:hypothetical protein
MAPQHRIPGARASTAQQKGFASNAYAALTSVENRTVVVSIGMFAVCSIPYLFLFSSRSLALESCREQQSAGGGGDGVFPLH